MQADKEAIEDLVADYQGLIKQTAEAKMGLAQFAAPAMPGLDKMVKEKKKLMVSNLAGSVNDAHDLKKKAQNL